MRVDGHLLEQGTKTHQSRRISLDDGTVAALKAHQERMRQRAKAARATITQEGFVFSHAVDASAPWHPDSTSRAFRQICQQAGVTGIRLHDLRHYVATHLLAAGIDVRTVAGRLGHRNPSTTLNVYSHFVSETDEDAADALGRIFEDAALMTRDVNDDDRINSSERSGIQAVAIAPVARSLRQGRDERHASRRSHHGVGGGAAAVSATRSWASWSPSAASLGT